jgi:hypothetical protein
LAADATLKQSAACRLNKLIDAKATQDAEVAALEERKTEANTAKGTATTNKTDQETAIKEIKQ